MRRKITWTTLMLTTALMFNVAPVHAQTAGAEMKDAQGRVIGSVILRQTSAGVLVSADLNQIPAGWHGFHVHSVGACEPTFKDAGGHFNPSGHEHGVTNAQGHHAGDMPNIYAHEDGSVRAEVLNTRITLDANSNGLFDADGSSIIVHANPDTHGKNPGAGARIACGVIEKSN